MQMGLHQTNPRKRLISSILVAAGNNGFVDAAVGKYKRLVAHFKVAIREPLGLRKLATNA